MKNTGNISEAEILRQKAEELVRKKTPTLVSPLSEAETLKLIHELEVHQVELEMQNVELIETKKLAAVAAEKCTELYDFAPSGYFTLSKEGEISELNICAAKMLGKDREHLINRPFGFFVSNDTKPTFNLFLGNLFDGKVKAECEITLSTSGKLPTFVHLSGISHDNRELCFVTMVDNTNRRQLEDTLRINDERLNDIIHCMADWVWEVDKNGKKIALSMRNSAVNLFGLLENLLEWSRLRRGVTTFEPETLLLKSFGEESLKSVLESANKKGIEIRYEIPENIEVYADRYMLGSTIRNLVSNSLKSPTQEALSPLQQSLKAIIQSKYPSSTRVLV